jgi:hypothetical protein
VTRQRREDLPVIWHDDHGLSAIDWEYRRRVRKAVARSREDRARRGFERLLGDHQDKGAEA